MREWLSERLTLLLRGKHLPPTRALLCIPHGGMNDTLCQIERCRAYAQTYGRTLLIDTSKSGLFLSFSTFFSFRPTELVVQPQVSDRLYRTLRQTGSHPNPANGLGLHAVRYGAACRNFVDGATGQQLTFDFEADHPFPLLLHEQCGGGDLSHRLLHQIVLTPPVRRTVAAALRHLPSGYAAVHVRNSDYRTNYEDLFERIRPNLTGADLLVCSDDSAVIARARQVFDRSRVLTVTDTPDNGNRNLHDPSLYTSDRARSRATVTAITDLLALGGARELHFTDVTRGYPSGFSTLAGYLQQNQKLIDDLLARPARSASTIVS